MDGVLLTLFKKLAECHGGMEIYYPTFKGVWGT